MPPWPDPGCASGAGSGPGFDPAEADDLAACRAMLRTGSRSFHAAATLLPRSVRDPACAVYAFCRVADDAVDGDGATAPGGVTARGGGEAAVARLRERLGRAYAGRPLPRPEDRALARVVARHAVPRALLDALLEGFDWDASGRRYETLADLRAYAVRVAGSVGAVMAVLMGARAPEAVARACDLGVAMQLTNIARDVGEDARAGRLYLPRGWLREAGLDPDAWLARPVFDPALGEVVRRLLHAADELYTRADSGVAGLPAACRPGIGAARLLYAEIGREVARAGFDSVARRVRVPAGRKAALLARGLARSFAPVSVPPAPPLEEARFLVEAVCAGSVPARAAATGFDGRVAWLVGLFERLERLESPRPAR